MGLVLGWGLIWKYLQKGSKQIFLVGVKNFGHFCPFRAILVNFLQFYDLVIPIKIFMGLSPHHKPNLLHSNPVIMNHLGEAEYSQ